MRPVNPWAVLGIGATRDTAEIRRAYARRLKVTHPEDDAEGFQALRAAYERAMQQAAYAEQTDRPVAVVEIEPEAEAAEEPAEEPPPRPDNRISPATVVTGPAPAPAEAATGALDEISLQRGELAEHQARCQRLWELVSDAGAEPAAVDAALKSVLQSPAMDAVAVHDETEQWLAWVGAGETPWAGRLATPLIAHFGWSDDHLGWRPAASDGVFARRREEALIEAAQRRDHPQHRAFLALTREPTRWRLLRYRMTVGLAREVRELLATLRLNWPTVLARLNPAARAWWEDYLARPQLKPTLLFAVPASIPFCVLGILALTTTETAFDADQQVAAVAGFAVFPAMLAALAFAWLYGVDRVRWAWRRREDGARTEWLSLAWAPAAFALPLLAALIPPSAPALIATHVIGLVMVYAAAILADPDRRDLPGGDMRDLSFNFIFGAALYASQVFWRPGLKYPWVVRSLFAFAYLAVYWIVVSGSSPEGVSPQLGWALALAAAAVTLGADNLNRFWTDRLSRRWRTGLLGGLAAGVVLALALLRGTQAVPGLLAPGLALAGTLVLVHKPPGAALDDRGRLTRDLVMRFGWILAPIPAVFLGPGMPGYWSASFWLLSGVAATALFGLIQEWGLFARKPVKNRQPLNL